MAIALRATRPISPYHTRLLPAVRHSFTNWYNSHRIHSYLDYQSPNNFEQQNNELQKVA